jgi:hypothetical protein
MFGGQIGAWKDFSSGISVFPCQYHSANAAFLVTHLALILYNLSN